MNDTNSPSEKIRLEGLVLVPRDLIGAACAAIEKKRHASKTLEQMRRYATGDLSVSAQHPAVTQPAVAFDLERLIGAARKVAAYRPVLSYNDAYFGEPAGTFKQLVAELDRALPPVKQQSALIEGVRHES